MNRRQKIIVSITGIFIVLLALIGLTYAYFLTKITGNPTSASISVTTANLALEYEEGTPVVLSGVKIVPDTILGKKTFAVTNKGDAKVEDYGVYLVEVVNTMKYKSDVQIRMTCTTYATTVYESNKANIKSGTTTGIANLGECNGYSNQFPGTNSLLTTNSINVGETQVYSLEVEYLETGENQTDDMAKELSGMLHIANQQDIVDLEGTVSGASTGDYVQINSTQRISKIVDGKYKLAGIEAGTHSLKVMGSNGSPKGTISISIKKGKTPGVSGTNITIDNDSQTATVDITGIASTLTISATGVKAYNPFNEGTFAYEIIKNGANVTKSDGTTVNKKLSKKTPDFTKVADGSDESNMGLFQTEDDHGPSYYFRGPVTNNYVNFAGYCWRIVRIEGDESVRLALASEDGECSINNLDSTSAVLRDDNKNVIYRNMSYNGTDLDGKYDIYFNENYISADNVQYEICENCEFNTIKKFIDGGTILGINLDTYSETNARSVTYNGLNTQSKSILKSEQICLGDLTNVYDYNMGDYIFDNYGRLSINNSPSLKCPENSSKTLTTNAFVLTADEVVLAGAKYNVQNLNYYLVDNINGTENSRGPVTSSFAGNIYTGQIFYVKGNGSLAVGGIDADGWKSYRPVISVLKTVTFNGGTGTDIDPYEIS